ncbi:MAG: phosphopantetheine-binding protein [Defluviitaleaceae bacterium]|nr:phosphopantetheine-binding protein [Defluviitaleaceae bacterium]MCL2274935.1 phosphopantetheine-binding protein [Defluviitaleaceae bacterium]
MIEKLQEIVRQYSNVENLTLTPDMVLLNDLGLNSFELIELICEVENQFNVEIPDRYLVTLKPCNMCWIFLIICKCLLIFIAI